MKTFVTAEHVRALLDYDPATGVFTRRVRTSSQVAVGERAGTLDSGGYRRIRIGNQRYQAARLAWLWVHGRWPAHEIDHINRVRNDDRIANLREATRIEQEGNKGPPAHNNSGLRGVSWDKRDRRWRAGIRINGRKRNLGNFSTKEEASAAYGAAAREHFGEFFNVAAERCAP